MSESVFQEQTPEVQNAIIESGKMATAHSLEFLKREEALAKAELIKRGMEFDEVDESEWIERATTAVWPKYYESVGGVDKINSILRLLDRPEVN